MSRRTPQGIVGSIFFHGPLPEEGLPVPFATEDGRVLEFHDRYVRVEASLGLDSRVVRPILQPEIWP